MDGADEARTKLDARPGFVQLNLNWIAAASLMLAAAFLAALIVIASTQNAEALSSAALTVALVAFGAQVIVSIAQIAWSAAQQRDSERFNTETRDVLTQLQRRDSDVESIVGDVVGKKMDSILHDIIPRSVKEFAAAGTNAFDAGELVAQLDDRIRMRLAESMPRYSAIISRPEQVPSSSATDFRSNPVVILKLLTWQLSREDLDRYVNVLSRSDWEHLSILAEDYLISAVTDGGDGVAGPASEWQLLANLGLMTASAGGTRMMSEFRRLTEEGLRVCSVLVADLESIAADIPMLLKEHPEILAIRESTRNQIREVIAAAPDGGGATGLVTAIRGVWR